MNYAVSIMARQTKHRDCHAVVTFSHAVFNVSAANQDEAIGLGYRIAKKKCPSTDGWDGHTVLIISHDIITDYELA